MTGNLQCKKKQYLKDRNEDLLFKRKLKISVCQEENQ